MVRFSVNPLEGLTLRILNVRERTNGHLISQAIQLLVEVKEEIVIGAAVNLSEFNNNAGTNIQFACLIFRIAASCNITATALELCAELFLR